MFLSPLRGSLLSSFAAHRSLLIARSSFATRKNVRSDHSHCGWRIPTYSGYVSAYPGFRMSLSVPHSRGEVAGVAGFLGLRVDHPGPASSKIFNCNFSVTVIRHNFQIYFCGKLSASALPSTVAMQSSRADWDEPQSSRIACQPCVPARASHSFVRRTIQGKADSKLETGNPGPRVAQIQKD